MLLLLIFTTSDITNLTISNGKIINFIGKISLPLYIVHWLIGNIIRNLNLTIPFCYQYFLFLGISILSACLLLLIEKLWKKIPFQNILIKK